MIIDGRAIAEDIKQELKQTLLHFHKPLSLAIFITKDDAVIEKFVALKKKFADAIGVHVVEYRLGHMEKTENLLQKMLYSTRDTDGLIVQLPLSHQIDLTAVRQLLPITHDVDVYGETAYHQFKENRFVLFPPVVGAMHEILQRNKITLAGKQVVIVGNGQLVGAPAAIWAERMGGKVQVVDRSTPDIGAVTKEAEVLILGAGSPGLIKPDMIKEGVILLDAGTSETEGKLVGDADPRCAEKAFLFTPTPGGIGPITVAMIFRNMLKLHELRAK